MTKTDTPKSTCHFLAAAVAFYEREGSMRERHLNVLLETNNAEINKSDLGEITTGAMQRVITENGVAPTDIKDVVILNISMLGIMPSAVFHGTTDAGPN